MPPDSKDLLVLSNRLRYLEEWVDLLERNSLGMDERREKAQERGFANDIAALRAELTESWVRLLPHDAARPTNSAEMRQRRADAQAILVRLGLMRRLLAVEERLARACGESPPDQTDDAATGLALLATDPARALPILARAENASD